MSAQQLDSLHTEVITIRSECERALRTLKRWSENPKGPNTPKIEGGSFNKAHMAHFAGLIKSHCRALPRVLSASSKGPRKQLAMANKLLMFSVATHVCAVPRALVRKHTYASPDQIMAMASEGKSCKPLTEPITALVEA
jgi:hypothetical protein